jgi:predicted acylesterase/phospholipase RssA
MALTPARIVTAEESASIMVADAINEAIDDTRRGPVVLEVLTLSSGGQYGSFGAGFLRGWSENPVAPRPDFDLVTGVSAGASMATVAFAGRAFDPLLDVFRGLSEDDVFNRYPLGIVPFQSSLAVPNGLRDILFTQLSDAFIGQIARRNREDGAQLMISAVNIDTGRNRIFNLGEIANAVAPIETRRTCMVEAILASGAIPALFPPRSIDGDLYADGGLRDHVFFRTLESERAAAARRTGRDIRVNATIVVNGSLAGFDRPVEDTLPGYLGRSAEILADEVLRDSIIEAITFAQSRPGWALRGIVADADITTCGADAASGTFDACVTEILFDHGRSVASTAPIAWKDADALRDKANEF